jgi:hypothetical protein
MSLFERAARFALSTAQRATGAFVTLRRGDMTTPEVKYALGKSLADVEQREGEFQRVESRDFFISADDYRFDGLKCEPKPGDLIEEYQGTTLLRCRVVPFGGEPCFRRMDSTRTGLRIHTEVVAEFLPGQLTTEEGRPIFTEAGEPLMEEDS